LAYLENISRIIIQTKLMMELSRERANVLAPVMDVTREIGKILSLMKELTRETRRHIEMAFPYK
jgi:hypothetical protein